MKRPVDIEAARRSITCLRDAARQGGLHHFQRDPCVMILHDALDELEAARKPSDPIAAAVRAELEPLADALIEAGHKLAKDVPPDTWDDLCMIPEERKP